MHREATTNKYTTSLDFIGVSNIIMKLMAPAAKPSEEAMRKISMVISAFIILASGAVAFDAVAADATMRSKHRSYVASLNCQKLWRCTPAGCDWYRVCARPCPDGYSCSPLYGAYGPYGGTAYWGGYTDSGWSYRP